MVSLLVQRMSKTNVVLVETVAVAVAVAAAVAVTTAVSAIKQPVFKF